MKINIVTGDNLVPIYSLEQGEVFYNPATSGHYMVTDAPGTYNDDDRVNCIILCSGGLVRMAREYCVVRVRNVEITGVR